MWFKKKITSFAYLNDFFFVFVNNTWSLSIVYTLIKFVFLNTYEDTTIPTHNSVVIIIMRVIRFLESYL